jgi:membrane protein DedA with SNARE-associated domain/rhodanese-related sulfurtransferase
MESLLTGLSQHGYSILFAAVFLEAIGIPVPAALALLFAGGASARGSLHVALAVACALSAMVLADILMFLLGRHTGWWLLGMLCRLSLNPESCVLSSADSFYRRGRVLLVFAKFVPGINTMAPPLAGSMNMRLGQFLRFDCVGAALYVGVYLSAGFLFSGALGAITKGYQTFSRALGWVLAAAVAGYVAYQVWMWRKGRPPRSVVFISPAEAKRAMSSDGGIIYDVRSHGYYDSNATRIQGSRRLEPNAVSRLAGDVPNGERIYLYCTCVREATSARIAQVLTEQGRSCAVIEGGLQAWKKAGLPVESVPPEEIAPLPSFAA